MQSELAHGLAGTREQNFVRLLPARRTPFDDSALIAVAGQMDIPDDVKDGPDPEENMFVPAGYTYLGQFVDHDLTFDTTSSLNPEDPSKPTNLRTPTLDLDCVYGTGPGDQPYLYEVDGATLRVGSTGGGVPDDVIRMPQVLGAGGKVVAEGRAIIGDKRNDENSIVAQIQLAFIKYHNAVVAALRASGKVAEGDLFARARDEVRWTYQRMLVEDYLRRIIEAPVYDNFASDWAERGDDAYILYKPELRSNIPLEFAGAAYRFGHSMVRVGYRLNTQTALPVFDPSGESASSLTGFQPLPKSHVIDDWGRFFPAPGVAELAPGRHPAHNIGTAPVKVQDGGNPVVRLQFAYKIDPNLTGPLDDLPGRISDFAGGAVTPLPGKTGPALSLLNLRRGNKFALPSGQRVAHALGVQANAVHKSQLKVRTKAAGDGMWTFVDMPPALLERTPLWLYILAEAQRKIVDLWANPGGNNKKDVNEDPFFLKGDGAITQLGPVGGRLVMETFFGVMDADPRSYRNAAPSTWQPMVLAGGDGPVTFSRILLWTGLTLTNGFGA